MGDTSRRYKIFLSYPIYERPHPKSIDSLERLRTKTKLAELCYSSIRGDSDIVRVRNIEISRFINSVNDFDYFMTWDSDIEILGDDSIDRMIRYNVPFLGLLVSKTALVKDKLASVPMEINPQNIKKDMGLIKMRWLGAGVTLIHRDAIMKMAETCTDVHYDLPNHNMKGYALYSKMIIDFNGIRKELSEDWAFCERFRKVIGDIYADTSIVTVHHGDYGYRIFE